MSRFFFHLWTPEGRSEDTQGCDFASLEAAYLDTHRAIVEISAEMLAERRDPGACAFEICNARGERLMLIPFGEALRPAGASQALPFWVLRQRIEGNLRRGRELHSELADSIEEVRASMAALRHTLKALG